MVILASYAYFVHGTPYFITLFLNLSVLLYLTCAPCKKHTVGSCFLTHSDYLCLLITLFNVIIAFHTGYLSLTENSGDEEFILLMYHSYCLEYISLPLSHLPV